VKGIAHFLTGVALATFFPEVVRAGAQGSLLPVLGGIAGLLPDTLDFRFARYFEKYDEEIDPGPEPDAHDIAGRVVAAMRRAYESGKPQSVMLHTIRLGADLWRQYTIRFDPAHNEVAVRIGAVVNTAQVPLPAWAGSHDTPHYCGAPTDVGGLQRGEGSHDTPHDEGGLQRGESSHETPHYCGAPTCVGGLHPLSSPLAGGTEGGEARVKVGMPMAQTYDAENRIDIFSGPSFKFERQGDRLYVHFLDWHRRWSHSLTLAAMVGALAGLAAGLVVNWKTGLWAGLVTGLGFVGHVLEDQLGYMGSNLFWPLTRKRIPGLKLIQSGDAIPNFLTVWSAAALILFNLDRFSATPRLDPAGFLLATVALPLVALGGVYTLRKIQSRPGQASPGGSRMQRMYPSAPSAEARRQADVIAEAEEPEIA